MAVYDIQSLDTLLSAAHASSIILFLEVAMTSGTSISRTGCALFSSTYRSTIFSKNESEKDTWWQQMPHSRHTCWRVSTRKTSTTMSKSLVFLQFNCCVHHFYFKTQWSRRSQDQCHSMCQANKGQKWMAGKGIYVVREGHTFGINTLHFFQHLLSSLSQHNWKEFWNDFAMYLEDSVYRETAMLTVKNGTSLSTSQHSWFSR